MPLNQSSVIKFFSNYTNILKFVVGFSGGLDSTVLLHIMHVLNLPLHAVYVNHNLFKGSDDWEQHCKNICGELDIPLSIENVEIKKVAQSSLEEIARNARYQALFKFVSEDDALVTAHHKNDLVETLILQLMRGSGPPGLAAMQKDSSTKFGRQLRPLLESTREDLIEYATENNLNWVEDPSNEFMEFDRNFVRKEILPRLISRWPGALQTLTRVAELQANTLLCLRDLADIDLDIAKTDSSDVLNVEKLQALDLERLLNTLRGWISNHAMRVPSKKILEQIVKDIVCKQNIETSPVQTWGDGEIRRYREGLYLMKPLSEHDPSQEINWNLNQSIFIESIGVSLTRSDLEQHSVEIPDGAEELTIRFRQGGERLKSIGSKHHRSLKNLFQEADVPPWERDRIPLLYYQNKLISVLGYWNASYKRETSNCV